SRIGDAAANALRREHDAFVATAVGRSSGEVVKGTGDGAMCGFTSAAAALEAAAAICHSLEVRNRRGGERLAVRGGVSLGEVELEDGDLHGLAVTEAARLCDAADAGEIVVSEVVRAVSGPSTRFQFAERGPLELKGLDGLQVVWTLLPPPPIEGQLP